MARRWRVRRLGHTVVGMAASGEEPIQHAHEVTPDIILMDIRLRGAMDGIEAAQHIRAARLPIAIVYLSAYTNGHTLKRAQRTAPAGFLPKPYSARLLQMTLEPLLGQQ